MEDMITQVLIIEKTEGESVDHLRDLLTELVEQGKK